MFNAASKLSFTVAVLAVVVGFGAVFTTSDRAGFTALVFAGVLAGVIGLAAFYYAPRDPVVPASSEVESAAVRSVDLGDLPRSSPWPLLAAVAITLLAVGVGIGTELIVIGLILAALAALFWLAQVWREHPSWTQAMTDRLNDRVVVPIGLPLLVIVLAAIGAISLSRIFLAVSAEAAPAIGIVIAFSILGAFYLISTRDQIGREVLTALVAISAVLVIGAGVAGALKGEREFHEAGAGEHGGGGAEAGALTLTASEVAFDKEELDLPADIATALEFANEDEGVEHNLSIYSEQGGDELFAGELVAAGETATYEIPALEAGTYYFQCDVHPDQMNGSVVVAEDASGPAPQGGNATTTTMEH